MRVTPFFDHAGIGGVGVLAEFECLIHFAAVYVILDAVHEGSILTVGVIDGEQALKEDVDAHDGEQRQGYHNEPTTGLDEFPNRELLDNGLGGFGDGCGGGSNGCCAVGNDLYGTVYCLLNSVGSLLNHCVGRRDLGENHVEN